MNLEELWENDKGKFHKLDKCEFDRLCMSRSFMEGPWVEDQSEFMKEYGPYSPERWAFGRLTNNEYVCSMIAPIE